MSLIKAQCPGCGYKYQIALTKKQIDEIISELGVELYPQRCDSIEAKGEDCSKLTVMNKKNKEEEKNVDSHNT